MKENVKTGAALLSRSSAKSLCASVPVDPWSGWSKSLWLSVVYDVLSVCVFVVRIWWLQSVWSEAGQYCIYCRIYSCVLRTSTLALHCTEGKKLSIKWVWNAIFFLVSQLLSNPCPSVTASATNHFVWCKCFSVFERETKCLKVKNSSVNFVMHQVNELLDFFFRYVKSRRSQRVNMSLVVPRLLSAFFKVCLDTCC